MKTVVRHNVSPRILGHRISCLLIFFFLVLPNVKAADFRATGGSSKDYDTGNGGKYYFYDGKHHLRPPAEAVRYNIDEQHAHPQISANGRENQTEGSGLLRWAAQNPYQVILSGVVLAAMGTFMYDDNRQRQVNSPESDSAPRFPNFPASDAAATPGEDPNTYVCENYDTLEERTRQIVSIAKNILENHNEVAATANNNKLSDIEESKENLVAAHNFIEHEFTAISDSIASEELARVVNAECQLAHARLSFHYNAIYREDGRHEAEQYLVQVITDKTAFSLEKPTLSKEEQESLIIYLYNEYFSDKKLYNPNAIRKLEYPLQSLSGPQRTAVLAFYNSHRNLHRRLRFQNTPLPMLRLKYMEAISNGDHMLACNRAKDYIRSLTPSGDRKKAQIARSPELESLLMDVRHQAEWLIETHMQPRTSVGMLECFVNLVIENDVANPSFYLMLLTALEKRERLEKNTIEKQKHSERLEMYVKKLGDRFPDNFLLNRARLWFKLEQSKKFLIRPFPNDQQDEFYQTDLEQKHYLMIAKNGAHTKEVRLLSALTCMQLHMRTGLIDGKRMQKFQECNDIYRNLQEKPPQYEEKAMVAQEPLPNEKRSELPLMRMISPSRNRPAFYGSLSQAETLLVSSEMEAGSSSSSNAMETIAIGENDSNMGKESADETVDISPQSLDSNFAVAESDAPYSVQNFRFPRRLADRTNAQSIPTDLQERRSSILAGTSVDGENTLSEEEIKKAADAFLKATTVERD